MRVFLRVAFVSTFFLIVNSAHALRGFEVAVPVDCSAELAHCIEDAVDNYNRALDGCEPLWEVSEPAYFDCWDGVSTVLHSDVGQCIDNFLICNGLTVSLESASGDI